ncbi:MAG: hypothetical protein AAF696_38670 [Bacteroidota bacterium]
MKWKSILFLIFLGVNGSLFSQDLKIAPQLISDLSSISPSLKLDQDKKSVSTRSESQRTPFLNVSPVYLPKFARNNPTGYTYLCRLELQIEKDLPLGLWLDIGDQSTFGNPSNANANVRFRFKLRN